MLVVPADLTGDLHDAAARVPGRHGSAGDRDRELARRDPGGSPVTPGVPRAHTDGHDDARRRRAPSRAVLAAALVALTVGLVVVAGRGRAGSAGPGRWRSSRSWSPTRVMALSFGICGAILAWHRPGNPIGWLFAAGGLLQAVAAAVPPVGDAAASRPARRTSTLRLLVDGVRLQLAVGDRAVHPARAAAVPRRAAGLAALAAGGGRRRRHRSAVRAGDGRRPEPVEDGGPVAYLTLAATTGSRRCGRSPSSAPSAPTCSPWSPWSCATAAARRSCAGSCSGCCVAAGRWSWRPTLPWGLVAGTPIAVLLTIPLIPVAVTVAVVRYRLLDIRLVASRALTWLLLSLGVLAAYVALVAVAGPVRLRPARPVGADHGAARAGRGPVAAPAAAGRRPGDVRRPRQPGPGRLPARRRAGTAATRDFGGRGRRDPDRRCGCRTSASSARDGRSPPTGPAGRDGDRGPRATAARSSAP